MTRGLMVVAALLSVTPAQAQMSVVPKTSKPAPPPSVPSNPAQSANNVLQYCVSETEVPPNNNYEIRGFCSGVIYSLMTLLDHDGVACVPEGVTVEQARRVVVRYVSARPERMHEYFISLAEGKPSGTRGPASQPISCHTCRTTHRGPSASRRRPFYLWAILCSPCQKLASTALR